MISDIFEAGVRPIWIASYPRSGNTFLRIILQNVFDLPSYSLYRVEGQQHGDPSAEVLERAPFLPRNWCERLSDGPESSPILIKTHEAPDDEEQAIYLVRDGRAAIQSYCDYHQRYAFDQPSLTEIIAGACQFGSWSEHYLAWQPQTRPRTLFLRYEELVARPLEIIPALADFLKRVPIQTNLPSFTELNARLPGFFRRGQNRDFMSVWAPEQVALFNQLHGSVMQELGYSLVDAADADNKAVAELARSAARLHRLYMEQLRRLGLAAASQQELAQEVASLSKQLVETRDRLAEKEKLLNKRWLNLGKAVGAMRKVSLANRR